MVMLSKMFCYILAACLISTSLATMADGKKMQPNIKVFMCGDVMTGRGIDQVLAHPSDPLIHESYLKSARGYVQLAETANGRIRQPVSSGYIWGDALAELKRAAPDVSLINLETSITVSNDYWKGKGIHYRMNPQNIASLTAAGIDFCALANNHVLDWGHVGLLETLATLQKVNIKTAGAGPNAAAAGAPAVIGIDDRQRVIVFSFGLPSSGIPSSWSAAPNRPGVNLLKNLSVKSVRHIQQKVQSIKRDGDLVVVSVHWGGNWGYDIPRRQIEFAHRLVDDGGADIVHGHSSHHVKAIEVYKGKLILYGCGDFLNDYEGIGGYEKFRADLSLMYFATLDSSTGNLVDLQMVAMQIRRFQTQRASRADTRWLGDTLNREGRSFGTRVMMHSDNRLILQWEHSRGRP
jgi:poly-gamma-glutamate synthesis protein (capsule biosynthesis protein)